MRLDRKWIQSHRTSPFDDTMVMDSPLVETQLGKLDFETQVADDSDCFEDMKQQSFFGYEEEVVPDSEDEGVLRTKIPGADKAVTDGSKECSVLVERTDEQKDFAISSQEPGESSQANALEFVDQFLSHYKIDLSPEHDIKKVVVERSLSVSAGKGPQSLAKRMKFGKTYSRKSGTFEWADSDLHGKDDANRKSTKASFEFKAQRQETVMRDQKATNFYGEQDKTASNGTEKNEELVDLHKVIVGVGSNNTDSRVLEHTPKDSCSTEQVCKMNFKANSTELNENMHPESSEQLLDGGGAVIDAPDTFDVGFNTQIAAEAMEALSYASSSSCTVFNANQVPSSTNLIMSKPRPDHACIQKNDISGIGSIAMMSKRGKRTVQKFGKNSNKEPHTELPGLTKVRRDNSGTNSASCSRVSGNRCPAVIVKGQADENIERNNEECENHMISSILVDKEEGVKNITVAQESRQPLAEYALKRTNKQSDNPSDRMDDGIIKYRRKRSRLVGNPTELINARGTWSALQSNTSAEAKNKILGQKEENCKQIPVMTSLNLGKWSHPKRKRTQKVNNHSNGAISIDVDVGTITVKQGSHGYEKKSTIRAENFFCHKEMQGPTRSRNSPSAEHLPEKDTRMHFDEPGLTLVLAKSQSPITGNDLNAAFSSPEHFNYHRKPFSKSLPKSSLLKELSRLDVPERIPDFKWKDLRRKRDMAHVRVLFSQHLDDDIIKQQKKISARLRVSIATCPQDATHFIADRFTRTRNMLKTIALGKPVVTHLWLESCAQANCLLDEKNYILRDAKKEKETGFSMPVTYARASQHPLLKGRRVFITPSVKPNKEMITSLVKAVQGQVIGVRQIKVAKEEKFQDDLLILSCEEDHAICVPLLDKGLAAYSSELLLNGIVVQKLQFERHLLFKNNTKGH